MVILCLRQICNSVYTKGLHFLGQQEVTHLCGFCIENYGSAVNTLVEEMSAFKEIIVNRDPACYS